jgi:hypothetical protein
MLIADNFVILEDHDDIFQKYQSQPLNHEILGFLNQFDHSQYYKVISIDSFEHHLNNLPVTEIDALVKLSEEEAKNKPPTFEYIKDGQTSTLVYENSQFYLNNNLITTDEVQKLEENVRQGYAELVRV